MVRRLLALILTLALCPVAAQADGFAYPPYPIPLPCAQGGTGLAAFTIGDIIVANATCGFALLSDIATGNVLLSGGVGAAPSYGKVALASAVSGTLPCANGGTALSSYAVGDILYASASCTISKLADVATGSVLVSGGVGAAPSYTSDPAFSGANIAPASIPGSALASGVAACSAPVVWTPTDQSGASLSLTVSSATYCKAGRVVTVNMFVTYPATASASAAQISLPFTANAAYQGLGLNFESANLAFTCLIIPNTTTIGFDTLAGGNVTNLQLTGAQLIISGSYIASS